MIELRPYQQAAVNAVYGHLERFDDNPVVVLPTAAGKTPVMAAICRDAVQRWGGRVAILAHVKELLGQAADKLQAMCPEVRVGVYSAGLNRREVDAPVIVAGIQSVYKRACDFGPFDLVLVDEAHMIPLAGDGMYRQFLADARVVCPHVRTVGLTATPYRLAGGRICGPGNPLNAVCYEAGVKELITAGWLCPPVSRAGQVRADMTSLHVRSGEFIGAETQALMDQDALVDAACREIVELTAGRKSVLIFAAGIHHAAHVQRVLQDAHHVECGMVTGMTPAGERDHTLARFRGEAVAVDMFTTAASPLKYLVNVNVLTTGFDAPNIDCVVLLRPTLSPGLYYQMVGRGFRLHPGKQNCLVLDYGGNVLRHGPVDAIVMPQASNGNGGGESPAKECPECHALIAAGFAQCPECGYEFPAREAKHDTTASSAGVLTGQVTEMVYPVRDVFYSVHEKRGAEEGTPKTMRVDYGIGWQRYQSEWVCVEHDGYAREKAIDWWRRRSNDPFPDSAQKAVDVAKAGGLAAPLEITVRSVAGEKYDRIVDCKLGPKPEPTPFEPWIDPEDIPF